MEFLSGFFHKACDICAVVSGFRLLIFIFEEYSIVYTNILSHLQLDSWVVYFCYHKQCCHKQPLKT